jgi:hypothetical protein
MWIKWGVTAPEAPHHTPFLDLGPYDVKNAVFQPVLCRYDKILMLTTTCIVATPLIQSLEQYWSGERGC